MPEAATFEHYEVQTRDDGSLHELGRGAMGITYKAYDTNLRVPVALKVINATFLDSEVARQRFVREARSAAKLRHRNVATVYHLGTETETWFYAMEYIEGETLDALIKRQGPLNPLLALQITDQVARALNAAQRHELVHRDIKPANLMLVREDDELVVKVIDFGLAKSSAGGVAEDAATISMGGFVGTPHFASPEQLEEREIDVRSDIYSLGVTLWYMLTGQTPFAGSMAQVMSQHLSKPPPFEQFTSFPAPLAGLLRCMLEKDPAARPQSPAELRKAIEASMAQVSESPAAVAQAVGEEENFATLLEDASGRAAESAWETGATIAARYRITESRGETNAGKIYRARDVQGGRDVRLLRLKPELLQVPGAAQEIEREAGRLAAVEHPQLLRIIGFAAIGGASYLVMEWTEGFSLVELLRARRELDVREVLLLLAQAAAGADAALAADLRRVDFALHEIRLHFAEGLDRDTLLRLPVTSWPPFAVKLNPLGLAHELAFSRTWAGGATMVGGLGGGETAERDPRLAAVQALAAIVYELLGGAAPAGGGALARGYTPLSTLSEEGNAVLKTALDPAVSFPSAEAFHRALSEIAVLDARRPEPRPAPARPSPARPAPPPLPPAGPGKKVPVAFFGGVIAVLAIGAAVWFFPSPDETSPDQSARSVAVAESTPPPQVEAETPKLPPATPAPESPKRVDPPAPPVVPLIMVLPPEPTRAELLKTALEKGARQENEQRWPEALSTYLESMKEHPESESPRVNLEGMLGRLIKMPKGLPTETYVAMKDGLHEAAGLDVVAAMALLADSLRERDRVGAFNWMAAAADRGNVHALTQTGLMLSNGHGCAVDAQKAVVYFTEAAEKGDPSAMAALGECYLLGLGVAKNEARAVQWLNDSVRLGDARGANRLGVCYHKGIGVPRDPARAFQLFTDAARLGLAEANGNLGVLYLLGHGVKTDPAKGVSLIQKAAQDGDVNGMFLLAQALLEGTGISQSRLQAGQWMRKASENGHKGAQLWCKENGLPFTVSPTR